MIERKKGKREREKEIEKDRESCRKLQRRTVKERESGDKVCVCERERQRE